MLATTAGLETACLIVSGREGAEPARRPDHISSHLQHQPVPSSMAGSSGLKAIPSSNRELTGFRVLSYVLFVVG